MNETSSNTSMLGTACLQPLLSDLVSSSNFHKFNLHMFHKSESFPNTIVQCFGPFVWILTTKSTYFCLILRAHASRGHQPLVPITKQHKKGERERERVSFAFCMAMDRARPIRCSSPFRFFPSTSNLRRDQMVSKGFGLGALVCFIATAAGPPGLLFFLFFFLLLPLLLPALFFVGFDFFAIGVAERSRRGERERV